MRRCFLTLIHCAAGLAFFSTPLLATPTGDQQSAPSYLSFESVADGRCQILSSGGKLRVLHNQHPDTAIKYRLIRTFVGKSQGRSVGVAQPGDAITKLGCTRVDGREQDWVVERAQFVAEQHRPTTDPAKAAN